MEWSIVETIPRGEPARIFEFREGAPVVGEGGLPRSLELEEAPDDALPLGLVDGVATFAVERDGDLPTRPLLELFRAGALDDDEFGLVCRGKHLLEWRANHRFCGRCGGPATFAAAPIRMSCAACGAEVHPRISPCIIVLVTDGDRVLLVQGRRPRRWTFHSCVAGFVEAGETLEQAVVREVKEETGVEVDRVTYFGSQPWPFPDQLMVGFVARYAGGEAAICDPDEIADVRWFEEATLPPHPSTASIAGRLIRAYFDSRRTEARGPVPTPR